MSRTGLSILIPAAGASERLGQSKQLVKYHGTTLIQKSVENAFAIGPAEVIVVTGYQAGPVKRSVRQSGVIWVHNQRWSEGMGTSIATGAARVNSQSSGLMVLLCDQWRIGQHDLSTLAEQWKSSPKSIVCAQVKGRNMPPAIFPSSLFRQLRALEGHRGAQTILAAHAPMLTSIPLENAAFDLDTKADLSLLKSHEL
jgi:CTP:molybdopterin cytidylyltransferase MocA